MKKKIGCVIAYKPNHTNYGTSLVGYALVKKIQSLGYDLEIINYKKRLTIFQKVKFIVNAVLCGELKELFSRVSLWKCIYSSSYLKGLKERISSVENYKAKHLLPFFHDFEGFDNLSEGSKQYDVVVVGSDQVWTPMSLPNKFFNLLFVDDSVRKISYASSFGVSVIPRFQKKATAHYLNRFHSISVREQKGKEIVDSISSKTATVVADPTMLLTAKEWESEIYEDIREDCQLKEPYIFCYFLGTNPEGRNAAEKLKKETGFKIVTLRHMDEFYEPDENFGDEAPYDVDPNGFLRLIHNAEYVCTDSFHCTAFSIQFHKQFMTFYRFAQSSVTGRNSRIDSLFDVLKVDRSRIYSGSIKPIYSNLNWNLIDSNLNELRTFSLNYLKESLL